MFLLTLRSRVFGDSRFVVAKQLVFESQLQFPGILVLGGQLRLPESKMCQSPNPGTSECDHI